MLHVGREFAFIPQAFPVPTPCLTVATPYLSSCLRQPSPRGELVLPIIF